VLDSRLATRFSSPPTATEVERWFQNVRAELDALGDICGAPLRAYYEDAGLLRPAKEDFFRAHYVPPLVLAATHLFGDKTAPHILDLGCGLGTQSLFFALLGAKVTALDRDGAALTVLEARKELYEKAAGRGLDIMLHQADSLEFDYCRYGPFEGLWSMFAFNMMQPSRALLAHALPALANGARVAIFDGNRLHWGRRLRRKPFSSTPTLTPLEFPDELARHGLLTTAQRSGVVFPPMAYRTLPSGWLKGVHARLDGMWRFPVSHLILAHKASGLPHAQTAR
jgi:SAM-dependent methyltransferase